MVKEKGTLFFVRENPGFEDCDAAVLGVAFDEGASFGKGAALAPEAIMQASQQVDIEKPFSGELLQSGIHNFGAIRPKGPAQMTRETGKFAKKAVSGGKFFILLGGDHSVVNGLLEAVPKEACFVNFDAHLDLREQWRGKRMSHAAVSKRIFDKDFEQCWVGVRDRINEEEAGFVSRHDLAEKIFYCATMPKAFYEGKEPPGWIKRENLIFGDGIGPETAGRIVSGIGAKKVWLNIDIDCLDTGQGIETGTPVPFGLSLKQLNEIIFALFREKDVLGLSIAEVIPGRNKASESIAAAIIYNALLLWEEQKLNRP